MSVTCPSGHESEATDYCDTCGAPIVAGTPSVMAPPPAPPPAPAPEEHCPNCDAVRPPDDAFCEVCGLDFATGQLPASTPSPPPPPPGPPPAGPAEWIAVVEADRAFHGANESAGAPIPYPDHLGTREIPLHGDEVLVGRRSDSRGIYPDLDLGPPHDDPGVSRRHAVLRRRGDGWVVVDEGSTNGTWVGTTMLEAGQEAPLADGDHVLVGAWTRITVRRAPETAAEGATP